MFVSTSAATPVEILAPPAAIFSSPAARAFPLPRALPLGSLIEERQTSLWAVRRAGDSPGRRHDTDRIARGHPVDLLPGTDAIAVGDGFRNGDLELAGDPGHDVLVLARM